MKISVEQISVPEQILKICLLLILMKIMSSQGLLAADKDNAAPISTTVEVGKIVMDNVPEIALELGEKVASHMRTANSYTVKGWNHAGTALLFSKSGDLYEARRPDKAFRKILDHGPVSFSRSRKVNVCGKPGFVTLDDEDNDEYNQVYVARRGAKEPVKISLGSDHNRALQAANKAPLVAYSNALRGAGRWSLIVQATCSESKPRVLATSNNPIYAGNFDLQDKLLLATSLELRGYTLTEWDLETGDPKVLFKREQSISNARFGADGRYIFYINNDDNDYKTLYRYDRVNDSHLQVLSGLDADVESIRFSDDRSKLAVSVNRLGFSSILIIDANKLKLIAGPQKQLLGVISSLHFSPDGERLALQLSQPAVPNRSGTYDYKKEEFRPWSGGFRRDIKLVNVIPELIQYPTFDMDGEQPRTIPALVYRPQTASSDNPAAVVIEVHGGPESQARPNFGRRYHYYVTQLGVALIRPNIRGSDGYGRKFELLDEGLKREDAIKDIGALLNWIEAQPELDASRVIISGGSYGGYVSLASMAAYSERLAGAISRVGITDFTTFLRNTEPYRVTNRRREYGDERDPQIAEFFSRISPLRNIEQFTKPVLIIQGEKDPRVPAQQANDMVAAIRKNGTPVWYLLVRDEGHKFSKSRNKKARDGAQVAFIREILLEQ